MRAGAFFCSSSLRDSHASHDYTYKSKNGILESRER